jgi:hypothetical protein
LMVDQRVGEMSSCRQRRAEYRATGVPSARGGNAAGMLWDSPGAFLSLREMVRL